MSPPDGMTIRGVLADGDTGAGLGGLRVELWSANGDGPSLVAVSQSDDAGLFRFHLAPERLTERRPEKSVDVELRVLDDGTHIFSEARALPVDGAVETIELRVPSCPAAGEGATDRPEIAEHWQVMGHVKGSPPEGAKVRAVLNTLRNGVLAEQVVGESVVNSDGWYRMVYEPPCPTSSDTSL